MKKLMYFIAGLILAVAMVSCEKQDKHDLGIDALKAAKITYMPGDTPGPTSDNGIIPEIIPGDNKGGNRTCEEVWLEFGEGDEVCGEDYLCGDKVDYDDDPEGFASSFPDGLTVTVSGIHIEFEIEDDCLEFEGIEGFWKVGAVIVKGSNAANVYWYPDGETHDWGLAAPGNKPMVSNLTFCFVPCVPEEEPEDEWYAVKVWYDGDAFWAMSDGATPYYAGTRHWCDLLGFGDYDARDAMNMIHYFDIPPIATNYTDIGDITVNTAGDVTITLDAAYNLDQASLYVGDMSVTDLGPVSTCPDYEAAPWAFKDGLSGQTVTFIKGTDF